MGKIGDLWVRLGLKKDGYTKGMNEAKKENEGFGASLGKMKAGALAVWAAIGTAVVGFAKQMIEGTNRIGDAWNHTTAQMKAGWDVFIQSVSNWDWDNFIGRIRESAAAAKELQGALDFEFEASNSINLQKSMMSEELAQLQIDMRDVNKSYEERAAAAEKYLAKVKPIYEQEIELRKSLMEAYSGKWLAGSGLENTQEMQKYLQQFLVDYGRDQDLIKAVTDYNDKNASRETWEAARDYLEQYGQRTGNYAAATMAQIYETMRGDKDTEPLVKAIQDYYNALAAYNAENRRIFSVKNTATAGLGIGLGMDEKPAEGSIKWYETEINKLKGIISDTTDNSVRIQAQKTINEYEDQIKRIQTSISAAISRETFESIPSMTGIYADAVINTDNVPDIIPDDWLTRNREKIDSIIEEKQRLMDAGAMLADALNAGTSNALDELANAIAGVEGADAGSVVKALLTPLADAAIKAGMLIMAQGTAVEAFKESLMSLQGAAAIAAGAALIAVGVAAKAGLAAIGSGGTSSSGTSSYSSGAEGSSYTPVMEPQELTIHVDGRISGSDIVLASDRTRNKQGR